MLQEKTAAFTLDIDKRLTSKYLSRCLYVFQIFESDSEHNRQQNSVSFSSIPFHLKMSESCRSDRDRPSTACPEAGVEEEENNKSALSSDLPSSQSESREIQSSLEQAGPNKDLDNYASSPDEIERQDPLEQLAQDSGAEETSPRGEDGMSKEPIKQSDEVRARDTASPEIEMKRPASPEKVLEVDQNPNEPPEHPNPGSPEVSDMEATSEAEASSEIKEETGEESDANFVPEEQFDFEAVKEEMLFNEQDEDFDSTGNGPDPLAQESIKEEIKMEEQEYPPGLVPLPLPDVSDSEDRIEITDDWQESLSPRSTCSLTMHACTFPNCPKYFSKKSRLEIHFRTHTSEKPFVCDVEGCSAAYARKEHLRRHKENTHKSERWEYKCSKCPKKYMNSYSLRVHFKTKHEDGAASRYEIG